MMLLRRPFAVVVAAALGVLLIPAAPAGGSDCVTKCKDSQAACDQGCANQKLACMAKCGGPPPVGSQKCVDGCDSAQNNCSNACKANELVCEGKCALPVKP
jgi:hypothetical protein